jgi:hypothetical protein
LIFPAEDGDAKLVQKMFTAFGKTFFDVSILRNGSFYVWIYVLDLPNEAEYINYHACIIDKSLGENVIIFHERDPYKQARSMVESHYEVIENENCFIFGVKEYKKYLSEGNNQVNYSLTITKVGEAKIEDVDDLNPFI